MKVVRPNGVDPATQALKQALAPAGPLGDGTPAVTHNISSAVTELIATMVTEEVEKSRYAAQQMKPFDLNGEEPCRVCAPRDFELHPQWAVMYAMVAAGYMPSVSYTHLTLPTICSV